MASKYGRNGFTVQEAVNSANAYNTYKCEILQLDDKGEKTGEEVMNPIGLSASQFIAPMMKAIQELSAKVTALENA